MHEVEIAWKALMQTLKERELAIITGAGVSRGSGLPNWRGLTQKLLEGAQIDSGAMDKLELPFPAQLEIARRAYAAKHKDWTEVVRDILYKPFRDELRGKGIFQGNLKAANKPLADSMQKRNPVLAAIVELCVIDRPSGEHVKNPRIGAVLNYNIDCLLQVYDRARHGSPRIFRTIERASASRRPEKLNLYQLHGYLKVKQSDPTDEAADKLVLTEPEYHDRTDDPYNFANSSLLWALREFTCLFIGCSMTDELMRRSLYRSLKERTSALQAEGVKLEANEDKWRRHFAVAPFDPSVNKVRDCYFKMLGVKPLWVEDFHADLPKRLSQLDVAIKNVP
jgi:hypothetical protein